MVHAPLRSAQRVSFKEPDVELTNEFIGLARRHRHLSASDSAK